MKLKLYRVKTVLKHLFDSWPNSAFVVKQFPKTNRLAAYLDLLYWFYFYGNDFNDYCTFKFWEKSAAEKKSYISFRRNDKLRFALSTPEIHKLFLDKALFNQRFAKYVKRGWLDTRSASFEQISVFAKKYTEVIVKPFDDFGGHGVKKISIGGGSDCILTNCIIEECIANIESLRIIAPGSLNTIRIVTLIDKNGKLHILAALLRMGNGRGHTDNYHDGGMACPIDLVSGKLKDKAYGMNCVEYSHHPMSGIKFDGYKVDGFAQCLEIVKEVSFVEPQARYVGWDFAVTPVGIELLEGNIPPGEDITQIATGRGLWNEIIQMI